MMFTKNQKMVLIIGLVGLVCAAGVVAAATDNLSDSAPDWDKTTGNETIEETSQGFKLENVDRNPSFLPNDGYESKATIRPSDDADATGWKQEQWSDVYNRNDVSDEKYASNEGTYRATWFSDSSDNDPSTATWTYNPNIGRDSGEWRLRTNIYYESRDQFAEEIEVTIDGNVVHSQTVSGSSDSGWIVIDEQVEGSPQIKITATYDVESFKTWHEDQFGSEPTSWTMDYMRFNVNDEVRVTYNETEGRVTAGDENWLDMNDVRSPQTLDVGGVDQSASTTDLNIESRDNNEMICEVSDVQGSEVDLTSQCPDWTGDDPNNNFVKFHYDITRQTESDTSNTLTSWNLTYEESGAPQVESKYVESQGETLHDVDEYEVLVDRTDKYVIDETDRDIDKIEWYVIPDGEDPVLMDASNYSSPEAPPYEYSHEWDETGDYIVRADLYVEGEAHSESWEVSVDNLIIRGPDSYSRSTGEAFQLEQRFESTHSDVEVWIEWDDQIVRLTSGPESDYITSGQSVTWEFIVEQAGYNGDVITVHAEAGSVKKTKDIYLSTTTSGFWLGGSGDGVNWLLVGGLGGVVLVVEYLFAPFRRGYRRLQ